MTLLLEELLDIERTLYTQEDNILGEIAELRRRQQQIRNLFGWNAQITLDGIDQEIHVLADRKLEVREKMNNNRRSLTSRQALMYALIKGRHHITPEFRKLFEQEENEIRKSRETGS